MKGFQSLEIKTYKDYKENRNDIFDIIWMAIEEYAEKHPDFIYQEMDKDYFGKSGV